MKLAGDKKIRVFWTFLVLIVLEYDLCQAMTNEQLANMTRTVVFIGTLQEKESTHIDKDGKCEVIHKTEPEFIATGFLVSIAFPDFSVDDFNSKLTVQNLRKVITADIGDISPSSPPEAIDWLSRLIRMPELYDKIIAKRDTKTLEPEARKQIETFKNLTTSQKPKKIS
jgi:hypothetical protein